MLIKHNLPASAGFLELAIVPIKTLLSDTDARAVLSRFLGSALVMNDNNGAGDMTLEQVSANFPDFLQPSMLVQIDNELVKIK